MGLEDDLTLCGHLPDLLSLSRAFTCPVCYELLRGPVVLPCGHCYCSGCIRQNIDFKTSQHQTPVCPSCRQPCDPNDLRACLTLREAVTAFSKLPAAVAQLIEATKKLCQPPARQEAAAEAYTEESSQPENHSLPHQQPSRKRKAQELPRNPQALSSHATAIRRSGRVATAAARAGAVPSASPPAAAVKPEPSLQHRRSTSSSSVEILSSSVSQSSAGETSSEGTASSDSDGKADWESGRSGRAVHKDLPSKPKCDVQGHSRGAGGSRQEVPGHSRGAGGSRQEVQANTTRATGSRQPGPRPVALPPGYVSCPVCGISTRSAFMNAHLDNCISRQQNQEGEQDLQQQQQQQQPHERLSRARSSAAQDARRLEPVPSAPAAPWPNGCQQRTGDRFPPTGPRTAAIFSSSQKPARAPVIDVPPKLVFNLISDKDLKKRLLALGLSVDGKKQDWVDRYQAYRRFLQTKMDEGTRCTQAQLRAGFLLQQRQQMEARRVVPRLDTGTTFPAACGLPSSRSRPPTSGHHYAELIEQVRARKEASAAALRGGMLPEEEQTGDLGRSGDEQQQQQQQGQEQEQEQQEQQGYGYGRHEDEAIQQAADMSPPHAAVAAAVPVEDAEESMPGAEDVEESMQGSGDFICE